MKIFYVVFSLFLFHNSTFAQVDKTALLNSCQKLPSDKKSIEKIVKIGKYYHHLDSRFSYEILKIAEIKCEENGDEYALGLIYEELCTLSSRLYKSSESMIYTIKLKELGEKTHNSKFITSAFSNFGNIYFNNYDYEKSIEFFKKAVKANDGSFEESQKYNDLNIANIGYIYYLLSQTIDRTLPKNEVIYQTFLKKAIYLHKNAFKSEFAKKSKYDIAKTTINLCLCNIALSNRDSMVYYFNYTKSLLPDIKELDVHCEHAFNQAKMAELDKEYLAAFKYFKTSLEIAKKLKYEEYIIENNLSLYKTAKKLGRNDDALNFLSTYNSYRDSVLARSKLIQAVELQFKNESQKKDLEIQRKTSNNKLLFGLILFLLIFLFLLFLNFKNRQQIQQLKITQLEKDKQLRTSDAILIGQEEERNRIAKDLHDGLGGMLSGVKISFMNMKENLIMSAENVVVFEKSISQLDNTITELRKVAHNLMPEALVKFGLEDAIQDFCTSMMNNTKINIIFEALGEKRVLDNTANIYVYRIIQELINNAVKHADSTQIIVQITTLAHKIMITVEDNGVGIDSKKLISSKGIGLSNIKHRVAYFKGSLEFDNNKPQGTVANIELNV